MKQTFEACGKLILTGEHFILYGVPAIALPWLDARLCLTSESRVNTLSSEQSILLEAWSAVLKDLGASEPTRFPFVIHSTIPRGSGFGSSAALCVAITQAAAALTGQPMEPERLLEMATRLEARFHGRSSGLDPAVILVRRPLCFAMRQPPRPVDWQLQDVGFVLAVSRQTRQTAKAVAQVREFAMREAGLFAELCEEMKGLVQDIERRLASSTEDPLAMQRLGERLNRNQEILARIGVSSPHLDELCMAALQAGAYGAKLTGAGLGGGMFAFADRSVLSKIAQVLADADATECAIYCPPTEEMVQR